MVTLTFDTDLQTRLSEGPNTSSLWIWHKSVQWFRRYFIHKQKSHRQRQKQSLMQFTVCGKNNSNNNNNITNLQSWNVTNQRYVFCWAPAMWQLQVVSSSLLCYQAKFLQYPCQPVLHCRAWTSPRSHENLSPISITACTSVSTVEHHGFYDAALPIWWLEHAPIQWDSVQHWAVWSLARCTFQCHNWLAQGLSKNWTRVVKMKVNLNHWAGL